MILFDITGNIAFDYFFSLNINLGLIVIGFLAIHSILKS